MDRKTIITVASSAAITLLATTVVGSFIGVFERGSDALTEDQIKAVLEEVLVTDEQKTYAQTLAEINLRLASIEANQTGMQRALDILTE